MKTRENIMNQAPELMAKAKDSAFYNKISEAKKLKKGWHWIRDKTTRSARLVPPNYSCEG